MIGINQDPLGIQGKRIKSDLGTIYKKEVWGGPLSNNRYVVIFFNRGEVEVSIDVSLKEDLQLVYDSYTQRDPIRHKDIALSTKDVLSEKVAHRSVEVRILTLKKNANLISE